MSYSTTARYKRVLREAILTPRDILLSIADYSTTRRDNRTYRKTLVKLEDNKNPSGVRGCDRKSRPEDRRLASRGLPYDDRP